MENTIMWFYEFVDRLKNYKHGHSAMSAEAKAIGVFKYPYFLEYTQP